jgi:hypothetical protein
MFVATYGDELQTVVGTEVGIDVGEIVEMFVDTYDYEVKTIVGTDVGETVERFVDR